MIRQLGIPAWFVSFSAADLQWPEMLKTLIRQEGKQIDIEQLDWSEKCGLLKWNPVTAARMCDHRWHCFLKEVILSPTAPIGQVVDHFFRVEFQMRGSPHCHCLFWVKDAAQIEYKFRCIRCSMSIWFSQALLFSNFC